jgi:hypothetical protein
MVGEVQLITSDPTYTTRRDAIKLDSLDLRCIAREEFWSLSLEIVMAVTMKDTII